MQSVVPLKTSTFVVDKNWQRMKECQIPTPSGYPTVNLGFKYIISMFLVSENKQILKNTSQKYKRLESQYQKHQNPCERVCVCVSINLILLK